MTTSAQPYPWRIQVLQADSQPNGLKQLLSLADTAVSTGESAPFSDQSISLIRQYLQANDAHQRESLGVEAILAYPLPGPAEPAAAAAAAPIGAAVLVQSPASDDQAQASVVAEIFVDTRSRGKGLGTALARAVENRLGQRWPEANWLLWSHGSNPSAQRIADSRGWVAVRELWKMSLSNDVELPSRELPSQVRLTTFSPQRDEQAWLELNAAAFAVHPEQGSLTLADLESRMAENWFDPAGFFLAWKEDQLLGFHWTKTVPAAEGESATAPAGTIGEVYAVGISPQAQGQGLGAALTVTGIEYLRSRGVQEVVLYVDAENTAATSLYQRLGFRVSSIDIQYQLGTTSPSV